MVTDGDGGKRVADVVAAGQGDAELAVGPAVQPDEELLASLRGLAEVAHHPVDGRVQPVELDGARLQGNRFALAAAEEVGDRGVVGAGDDEAIGRHLLEELREGADQLLERAVDIQVVGLDVRDDSDVRRVAEERGVELVRLYDDVLALSGGGVRAQVDDVAADEERRREARLDEHERDEGGGRRLAVRAGNGDGVVAFHETRHHVRALDYGDAATLRLENLRVVLRRGGSDDHEAGVVDVGGVVALRAPSRPGSTRRSVNEERRRSEPLTV